VTGAAPASLLGTFFNLEIAQRTAPKILAATGQTLAIGVLIIVTGTLVGILLASARYATRHRAAVGCIVAYADILRAIPPLVLLILVYFALPYVDVSIGSVTATWLCLSLVLSAFIEECVWSGLCVTPKGQMEAARASGMTWLASMRHVVLPQAIRTALPQMTNRSIATIKNTALGSVIGFHEVLSSAQGASSDFANPTPLTLCALIYIVMIFPVVLLSRYLENKAAVRR
jgi:polar amino acid transport system permease protein